MEKMSVVSKLLLKDAAQGGMEPAGKEKAVSARTSSLDQCYDEDIPRHLWNPKLHYLVYKGLLLARVLNKLSQSMFIISKWSLPFMISDYSFLCINTSPMPCICPFYPIILDLITLAIFDEEYKL
jgi:hypothetical protein